MVVLRVVPARPELGLPRGLLLLGAADALLDGARGLAAAVVAGRSPALGVCIGRGDEGEGEDKAWDAHELGDVGTIRREILLPLRGTG